MFGRGYLTGSEGGRSNCIHSLLTLSSTLRILSFLSLLHLFTPAIYDVAPPVLSVTTWDSHMPALLIVGSPALASY